MSPHPSEFNPLIAAKALVKESGNAFERVNATFQRLNQQYLRFKALLAAFFEMEAKIQNIMSSNVYPSDPMFLKFDLLGHENRKLLERVKNTPHLPLMMTGPNSSGKSTVINALVGGVLPSGCGHVTGRIVRLHYVQAEYAKICFSTVDEQSVSLRLIDSQPSISLACVASTKELANLLKPLLKRPDPKSPDYEAWTKIVVEVHYPFELLKVGFDIYDVPGTSITDDQCIQDNLKTFLNIVRPIPVFVYSNATLSDAESSSLSVLKKSMKFDRDNTTDIFFASSHFDRRQIANDNELEFLELREEHLDAERRKRYELLKNHCKRSQICQIPERMEDCDIFGCVNALNYRQEGGPHEANIFNEFVSSLLRFSTRCQQHRLLAAILTVLNGINVFYKDLQKTDPKELQIKRNMGLKSLEEFEADILQTVQKVVEGLPQRISDMITEEKPFLCLEASKLSLTHDDQNFALHQNEVLEEFRSKFTIMMFNRIVTPAQYRLMTDVTGILGQKIVSFLEAKETRSNDLLMISICIQLGIPFEINESPASEGGGISVSWQFAGALSVSIIGGFMIALPELIAAGTSIVMAGTMVAAAVLFGVAFAIIGVLALIALLVKYLLRRVDRKLKKRLAKTILSDFKLETIDAIQKAFSDVIHQKVEGLRTALDTQMNHQLCVIKKKVQLDQFEAFFRRLEMSILALKWEIACPYLPVYDPSKPFYDGSGVVYDGMWCNEPVKIKIVKLPDSDDHAMMRFYSEAHHQLKSYGRLESLSYDEQTDSWMMIYTPTTIAIG